MEIFENKINKKYEYFYDNCLSPAKDGVVRFGKSGEMIARMGGGDPTRGSRGWPLLASGRRVRNGERGRGRLRDYTELSPTRRGLRV